MCKYFQRLNICLTHGDIQSKRSGYSVANKWEKKILFAHAYNSFIYLMCMCAT